MIGAGSLSDGTQAADAVLTFSDSTTGPIPDALGMLTSGTYKPTNNDPNTFLPTPAPTGPYGSKLNIFDPNKVNGT